MSKTMRNFVIGCVGALVIAALGYMLWGPKSSGSSSLSTSTPSTTSVSGVMGTGSFTVGSADVKPPSLDRPILITASSSLTTENQKILRTIIENIIAQLRKEPTRVDLWIKLGTDRKIGGDYEGAIQAWEYVAQAAPKDISATAHGNLADLYMYFLKDYAKAETRYTQAIALNPYVIEYYRALYYLYRDIYHDKAKAQAILNEGLKNNPDNPDLLRYQAELKNV